MLEADMISYEWLYFIEEFDIPAFSPSVLKNTFSFTP